jgi:aspartyl-tRNA(Asn)/glutamyl-tRNA(Gln) amidotransferase subunit B
VGDLLVTPQGLADLIGMVEAKTITAQVGKEVFERMADTGEDAASIVRHGGLAAISGTDELVAIVQQVIAANQKAVADYRAGKEAALKFLIGGVMKETRGRANPQVAQELIARELG